VYSEGGGGRRTRGPDVKEGLRVSTVNRGGMEGGKEGGREGGREVTWIFPRFDLNFVVFLIDESERERERVEK